VDTANNKTRIAVLSPFLDKHHGTERIIIEWISRLAGSFDIHLYSQRVSETDLSQITWHRIPELRGPHMLNYLWWFAANHLCRIWDRHVRGIRYELVFSPGINCFNADVISVHIIFAEYCRLARKQLSFRENPLKSWPRLLHRKIYYRLLIALEKHIYPNAHNHLILIAKKTAQDLKHHYSRETFQEVMYLGLDHQTFNPPNRLHLRSQAREMLEIPADAFVLLLVGNDWKKKGLSALLDSLKLLRELPIVLLVVGSDDSSPYQALAHRYGVTANLKFVPSRPDVLFYYGAADANVGPSLEDTFALPTAEAMACGLPVITSIQNGTSEIIIDGTNGLLLKDPTDSRALAAAIRRLYEDRHLCQQLGENAARTIAAFTWEGNVEQIARIFREHLRRKQNGKMTVANFM